MADAPSGMMRVLVTCSSTLAWRGVAKDGCGVGARSVPGTGRGVHLVLLGDIYRVEGDHAAAKPGERARGGRNQQRHRAGPTAATSRQRRWTHCGNVTSKNMFTFWWSRFVSTTRSVRSGCQGGGREVQAPGPPHWRREAGKGTGERNMESSETKRLAIMAMLTTETAHGASQCAAAPAVARRPARGTDPLRPTWSLLETHPAFSETGPPRGASPECSSQPAPAQEVRARERRPSPPLSMRRTSDLNGSESCAGACRRSC